MNPKHDDGAVELLHLPTQTDSAYWIIVLVILGTAVAGSIGASPVLMWPITLTIIILPVRALLALPAKERRNIDYEATLALEQSGALFTVRQAVQELAVQAGFLRPIRVLVSHDPYEARAFGTWRHHYVFFGREVVKKIHEDWHAQRGKPKATAVLLHEIAHLVHKDVQRISYTRLLLRTIFVAVGWWMVFLLGWLLLAYFLLPAFLALDKATLQAVNPAVAELMELMPFWTEAQLAAVEAKAETISIALVLNYLVISLMPLVVVGSVLWLFFWRRMLRLQEYYADQLALTGARDVTMVRLAFARYGGWFRPKQSTVPLSSAHTYFNQVRQVFRLAQVPAVNARRKGVGWLSLHPSIKQRTHALSEPLTHVNDWASSSIAAGILLVALELLLVSPLASYYLTAFPVLFPTLTSFLLIATWWLPALSYKRPSFRRVGAMIAVIYGIRTAWLLLNIGVLLATALISPDVTLMLLNLIVMVFSRYAGRALPVQPIADLQEVVSWIPSFVALQILGPLTLVLLLACYYLLYHHARTRGSERNWRRYHWKSVVSLAMGIGLLFFIPVSWVINNEADKLVHWQPVVGAVVGVLALLAAWWEAHRGAGR